MLKVHDRERFHKLVTTTGKMDAYTAQLALREYYETHFGIFNHDEPHLDKTRPMILVAKHPKEDAFSYSIMHRFMWRFRQYEIPKHWGYDLNEFLQLPWDLVLTIFGIEQKRAVEQLKREEDLARKEKQMVQGLRNDHTGLQGHQYKPSGNPQRRGRK